MMSGAWPPPAPSVWKAWIVRPLNALIVSSTKPHLVERVGVDHHLHVVIVGDGKTAVDRRRRRAPVLMQLQRAGAGLDLFDQRRGLGGVALASEAEVHRKGVGRLDHARDMPGARGAGGRESAGRGAGAAAEHRGDAAHQGFVDLLRADEMDVRVEAAGGENLALARDHLGARADDDRHAGLDVRIAGLADRRDHAVLDRDVGLHDPPVIEDRRVGDDGVDRPPRARDLALSHAVANDLAAAELHLLAIGGEILLDLDEQLRVREPHAIPRGRPEHVGVGGAGERGGGTGVGALGHGGLVGVRGDAGTFEDSRCRFERFAVEGRGVSSSRRLVDFGDKSTSAKSAARPR